MRFTFHCMSDMVNGMVIGNDYAILPVSETKYLKHTWTERFAFFADAKMLCCVDPTKKSKPQFKKA